MHKDFCACLHGAGVIHGGFRPHHHGVVCTAAQQVCGRRAISRTGDLAERVRSVDFVVHDVLLCAESMF